jgi:hypothetical protein
MAPKELSFLDQNSESITHVFDLIGKVIKKPRQRKDGFAGADMRRAQTS